MEWKRAKGGVSVENCHDSLSDRISISGDYDSHECGLTITNLQIEDAGTWECEVAEYIFFFTISELLYRWRNTSGGTCGLEINTHNY